MTESTRKVAVVTGGTRGIGLAIAKRLAHDGYDLVVTYRGDEAAAQQARESLTGLTERVEVIAADSAVTDDAGRVIEQAVKGFGRLDVLVNNAGITRDTLIMRMSEADWDDVLTTNL
jgi:3-oxoacyl-[acyl-carrier protein] reductase